MTISADGIHISLMHYPMLSWPRSHYGSIMLHGHIHADESYNLSNRDNGIKRYGSCPWCEGNRTYKYRRRVVAMEMTMRDAKGT